MTQKAKQVFKILSDVYKQPKSELNFSSPFELLVAVILSAQCTDKQVNEVTAQLFKVANTPHQMMNVEISELERLVHSCGFYRNKAKFLHNMSVDVVERFGGRVPDNLDDLRTLDGVGRKTANVVFAVAFDGQAIAVDTHVFRVSNRLGLTKAKNVLDTEKQLMQAIDKQLWSVGHHYILLHGRYVCKSQRPLCGQCSLTEVCDYFAEKSKDK